MSRALVAFGIVAVVFLLALGGVLGYRYFSHSNPIKALVVTEDQDESSVIWKTYQNEKFGFEIQYPSNWESEPHDSSDADETTVSKAQTLLDIRSPFNTGRRIYISAVPGEVKAYVETELEDIRKWHPLTKDSEIVSFHGVVAYKLFYFMEGGSYDLLYFQATSEMILRVNISSADTYEPEINDVI